MKLVTPELVDEKLVAIAGSLPANHRRILIQNGVAGTKETITLMQQMVSKGKRDDRVREVVGKILNNDYDNLPNCKSKNYMCYAEAIYKFCRDHIKYAFDPLLVEYLESPASVLKNRIADCDSICMLMCSMFEQVGLESQFVTIKSDPQRPDEYAHVYVRVKIPRHGWVAADATVPDKWFGWEAPGYAKTYWPASTDMAAMGGSSMEGLGENDPTLWQAPPAWSSAKAKNQWMTKANAYRNRMIYMANRGKMTKAQLDAWTERAKRFQAIPVQGTSQAAVRVPASNMMPVGTIAQQPGMLQHGSSVMPISTGMTYQPYQPYGTPVAYQPSTAINTDCSDGKCQLKSDTRYLRGLGCGCTGVVMAGMGALGADPQEVTLTEIISGEYRNRLQRMWDKDKADGARVDEIFAAVQKMPAGAARNEANAAYVKARDLIVTRMKQTAEAKKKYNEIVEKVALHTAGVYRPALAGLGVPPLVLAALLLSAGVLVSQLASLVGSWQGNANATEGYLAQAARLAKESGVAIGIASDSILKVALVGGIGFALYKFVLEPRMKRA
jgi:hypothetical protein